MHFSCMIIRVPVFLQMVTLHMMCGNLRRLTMHADSCAYQIRIKEDQEKKFEAKRKAAEEAALKEKEARAQEIRERLEAKAVARQQKREEERERAKKAAMAVRAKPLLVMIKPML